MHLRGLVDIYPGPLLRMVASFLRGHVVFLAEIVRFRFSNHRFLSNLFLTKASNFPDSLRVQSKIKVLYHAENKALSKFFLANQSPSNAFKKGS